MAVRKKQVTGYREKSGLKPAAQISIPAFLAIQSAP